MYRTRRFLSLTPRSRLMRSLLTCHYILPPLSSPREQSRSKQRAATPAALLSKLLSKPWRVCVSLVRVNAAAAALHTHRYIPPVIPKHTLRRMKSEERRNSTLAFFFFCMSVPRHTRAEVDARYHTPWDRFSKLDLSAHTHTE